MPSSCCSCARVLRHGVESRNGSVWCLPCRWKDTHPNLLFDPEFYRSRGREFNGDLA